MIKGFRSRTLCDGAVLARCLIRVSGMFAEHSEFRNLDVNLLIIFEKVKDRTIVDTKMGII